MGQLERYGLYVLVLVIFLILGVAIWGGDPTDPGGGQVPGNGTTLDPASNLASGGIAEIETPSERHRSRFFVPGQEFVDVPPDATPEDGPAAQAGAGIAQPVLEPVGGQPRVPAPPAASESYVIQKGDILGDIARKKYGSSALWSRIVDANPGIDPNNLTPGKTIVLPPAESVRAEPSKSTVPALADATRHVVADGDNPSTISAKYYGTEKYAKLIMDANGIKNPKLLQKGTSLTIPADPGKN